MVHPAIQQIIQLFEDKSDSMYGGEAVTQLEHALQAAYLAQTEKAKDSLMVAALLHDIGHLLHDLPEMASEEGIDDIHEDLAANFLSRYFNDDVVEPVKLHVQAKRYLCAAEEGYYDLLSQPSKTSLEFQGGIMNAEEVEKFMANPYFRDAVALREWDDLAKDPDLVTPDLSDFITSLELTLKK